MVMVDALRHDYVNPQDAPFLNSLSVDGVGGSLIPSFGFEPDGAYFAGLAPEECNGGAQYWLNPDERTFYGTSLLGLLARVPAPAWRRSVRFAARAIAQAMAPSEHSTVRRMATTAEIPFELLGRFSFSLKRFAHEPGYAPSPTLFDALRKAGLRYYFHGYPEHSVRIEQVEARYLREERGGHALAFLFIGDLDRIGHEYGPDSLERRAILRRIDQSLARIYSHASARYRSVHLLVFGDHGMVEVRRHLDLTAAVARAGLDLDRDAYFLDSTLARFWIDDPRRRLRLNEILEEQDGGRVLNDEARASYRILWPHRNFGDVIFAADEGVLVHPSFYCSGPRPPKGMHGYLPECRDNHSAFILHGPYARRVGEIGPTDMRRLFPTVLDLLGLEEPAHRRPPGVHSLILDPPEIGDRGATLR